MSKLLLHSVVAMLPLLVTASLSQRHAFAASEAKNCPAEPTQNVPMTSGDVFEGAGCTIAPVTDIDSFRFSGQAGDVYRLAASLDGSGYPADVCIDLYDPSQAKVFTGCSNTTYSTISVTSDQKLATTGNYTAVIYESGNNATIQYAFSLQRLTPVPTEATQVALDQPIVSEINPLTDSDAYVVTAANTGTYRIISSIATGGYPSDICVDAYAPDGTKAGSACTNTTFGTNSLQFDVTPTQSGAYLVLVYESHYDGTIGYNLNVTCLAGTCPSGYPPCTLKDVLTYDPTTSTLTMTFRVGQQYPQERVTWNGWLTYQNTMELLFSVRQPTTDAPETIVQTRPNLPRSGRVGVLSTLTTPHRGIVCASWVQTGTAAP